MLLKVHKSLVKREAWLMINNIPWHIAYAMVLGLEPKEFDGHSLKVYRLYYVMYMITYTLYYTWWWKIYKISHGVYNFV